MDLPRAAGRSTLSVSRMKRVAIFGNAGGGKSTLARELAAITGLPLHVIDKIRLRPGGSELPREEYLQIHASLLGRDEWIIDGFDSIKSTWERFEAADTLIHIDFPLMVHAWWVTKRLVKGLSVSPEGWPENSPVILSSISSYRVLWPCYSRLTPKYRSYMSEVAQRKRVFHLRSRRELRPFLEAIKNEVRSSWHAHGPI
jgi:adenylate kinase family enzyme